LLLLTCDGRFLLPIDARLPFHLSVLFEELVKQHRIHRFVANGVRLTLLVTRDQIRVYFVDLLGHQTGPWNASRVNLVLVAKGDWSKREDRFARA
jgi:hypothetical protein